MIFPAPHPRETIASYGYRIARLSGLASLPELTHLFDLDLRALLMGDRRRIERLAGYAGCDPQALAHGALDARNTRLLQVRADPLNKVRCAPDRYRFCPVCIRGLLEGNMWTTCFGRIDWLVDANRVCAEHGVQLMSITPLKKARIQPDLSALVRELAAALHRLPRPGRPTVLERYIVERLDRQSSGLWIDDIQLDAVILTAEVLGALATRGPLADWRGMSANELRLNGHTGAEILVRGPFEIKDFLRQHIGQGRYGNDYHQACGRAFNFFDFRKNQPAYRPVCVVLAEYVSENFRLTHQEKVFGVETRGIQPASLRSLCIQHGIGLKVTTQVLKTRYHAHVGASDEVDPPLIAEIAAMLKEMLNARGAAHHLGVSVDVLRDLTANELLVPDCQHNNRMPRFRPETLDAFLNQWAGPELSRHVRNKTAKTPLTTVARANRTRTSRLLLAAKVMNVTFTRDRRRRGLSALSVADRDVAALLGTAKTLQMGIK